MWYDENDDDNNNDNKALHSVSTLDIRATQQEFTPESQDKGSSSETCKI